MRENTNNICGRVENSTNCAMRTRSCHSNGRHKAHGAVSQGRSGANAKPSRLSRRTLVSLILVSFRWRREIPARWTKHKNMLVTHGTKSYCVVSKANFLNQINAREQMVGEHERIRYCGYGHVLESCRRSNCTTDGLFVCHADRSVHRTCLCISIGYYLWCLPCLWPC